MRPALVLGLGLGGLCGGCTLLNDAPAPSSQVGPLRLIASTPPADGVDVALGSAVTLVFDGFPDPSSLGRFGAVTLRSGPGSFDITVSVDLVGRALVVQPRSPLTAGAGYVLQISSQLHGLDGAAAIPTALSFTAGFKAGGGPPPVSRRTLAADVQPLFDAGCALSSCHDSGTMAAGLTLTDGRSLGALVGAGAVEEPQTSRVAAGAPASSYLLRKLLGTPDIQGLSMPSGTRWPLESIRVVSDWIAGGAAP